jgi:hypothetical protein
MTHPSDAEATNDERASLRASRQALLALHKILLDQERARYERDHGRIETTHQHLQLVMEHPSFAWLRALSALIVQIDERLAGKTPLSARDARELAVEARALTTLDEEKTDYQRLYHRAIEGSPDALAAHASVARALAALLPPRR